MPSPKKNKSTNFTLSDGCRAESRQADVQQRTNLSGDQRETDQQINKEQTCLATSGRQINNLQINKFSNSQIILLGTSHFCLGSFYFFLGSFYLAFGG